MTWQMRLSKLYRPNFSKFANRTAVPCVFSPSLFPFLTGLSCLHQLPNYLFIYLQNSDSNLFSYPPGPDTEMSKICKTFQHSDKPLFNFLQMLPSMDMSTIKPSPPDCFDLRTTTGDSVDDVNHDMTVWDFQVCTDLSFVHGFSEKSMFPAKPASYESKRDYCREQYHVTPRPWELVDKWGFDDLSKASNILFTNGGQDIWSGGGITWNVSETVVSLFFPNGNHHSDLSLAGPSDRDTDDIKYGYVQIKYFLGKWIDAIGK
jgi:Serine carboxypeptidase S28